MRKNPSLQDHRLRWGVIEHERVHPLFYYPANVRILMYADFIHAYSGGMFGGLNHVIDTLRFDPFFWVRFSVIRASRVDDPTADVDFRNKRFDQITLTDYDEIWLFGFNGNPSVLTEGEINALRSFMDSGGGVLITGDHADLGYAIGQAVPRAGQMRKWTPTPSRTGTDRHSTLRSGNEPGFQDTDQSDDVPQSIRLKQYFLGQDSFYYRRYRPHELLCSLDGPIDVFPDHMHEGEAIVPTSLDPSIWRNNTIGEQVVPEVIAWGRVIEPGLDRSGSQFGIVSVYNGHQVSDGNIGRIVADSTWHHWFDINIIGVAGSVVTDEQGFQVSERGQDALKKIESYFLNVAIWLAPKNKQVEMRDRLFWSVVWRDPVFMASPEEPVFVLGKTATDSLGRYAPRCTINRFIIDLLMEASPRFVLNLEKASLDDLISFPSFDAYVMGVGIRNLLREMHEQKLFYQSKFEEQMIDSIVERSFKPAAKEGILQSAQIIENIFKKGQDLIKEL